MTPADDRRPASDAALTDAAEAAEAAELGLRSVLVPDVEEVAGIYRPAEELLIALDGAEEESAPDPEPWVFPAPLADGQALQALRRIWPALRDCLDVMSVPAIEPEHSTRQRLFSLGHERVPLRVVQLAHADVDTLLAAAQQLELALSYRRRQAVTNPWERKRLADLAEMLDQLADEHEPTDRATTVRPLVRLAALLNLPGDDAAAILVDALQAGSPGDVELTAAQAAAYERVATTINTALTGGDPLHRWLY